MCGRFALIADPSLVVDQFGLDGVDSFPPRYNIAPTQPVLIARPRVVIREGSNAPDREAVLVRWGLLPSWLKDPKGFPTLINARSETAADAKGKPLQAYWVAPKQGGLCAFAGLMETWLAADGSEIDTACILTTAARGPIAKVHDRMPVAIMEPDYARWLNCRDFEPKQVSDLFTAAEDDFFDPVPVSPAVNKVANSGPDLIVPVNAHPDAEAAPPVKSPATLKQEAEQTVSPDQAKQMRLF